MDSETAAPEPRKTVLVSTFHEGIAVALSHNAASPDPWATHLLKLDGTRLRGTYMSHWDDAMENFAQRCKFHHVEPDFEGLSTLTVAETAAALTDELRQMAGRWDRVYAYLTKIEIGFPGLWHLMARMAIIGEAEFGHLWGGGQLDYIEVLGPVVSQLTAACDHATVPLGDEELRKCWELGIAEAQASDEENRRKHIESRRRWPDWSAMADAIHNHEAYEAFPAFFGLRRVAMLDNPARLVHYLDADKVQRLMVSIDKRFTDEMARPWGVPILEPGEDGTGRDFRYLDGPEYWNTDSDAVDTLPC